MSCNHQPDATWATNELVSFALSHAPTDEHDDPHWEAIRMLHHRGTREVFDAATTLLAGSDAAERTLGASVHAQLGNIDRPFGAESTALLCALLSTETDANVIYAALMAFGHLADAGCVPTVVRFADHPDADIRYGVAFALAGHDDDRAESVLIGLTADPDVRVRDWATFDLASQTERDTPQLRAALRARLDDTDNVTRGEALKGLAARRDARAVDAVIAELGGPDPHENAVEAAEALADPRLVPALEVLAAKWGNQHGWLARVIAACQNGLDDSPLAPETVSGE